MSDIVDLAALSAWMDGQGLPAGSIDDVVSLEGGTQNVLLRFNRGGREYVLRHPPEHKRKNSDETMRREARVLAALHGSDVPHPELIAACPDLDVLGSAFYLMEVIDGINLGVHGMPETWIAADRHAAGCSMVDGIAALGRVDYIASGLDGFGRPDGWLERQVDRWASHLASYEEFEGYPGGLIDGVDEVTAWLREHQPTEWTPGVIHGDYHFLNVMFHPVEPRLAAVVDWELATIGDPLLDLGQLLAVWPGANSPVATAISPDDLPKQDEIIERYAAGSTRDLRHIDWYRVLACYRLGIILEGTHARAMAGKAPKEFGDQLHSTTLGLFAQAQSLI